MARKRMISPEFWSDEKVGSLPVEARLLFLGLISNADDEGRLPGNTLLIKAQVFPYDNYTVGKVEEWLRKLVELDMIVVYTVDKQTYIQVVNFQKHQTINRPTPSKIPPFEPLTEDSLNTHGVIMMDSRLKEKKGKEKNITKVSYAEYVFLLPEEYDRLIADYCEEDTKRAIEILDNYIGQNPGVNVKKYTDHNRVIRNWVMNRVAEEKARDAPKNKGSGKALFLEGASPAAIMSGGETKFYDGGGSYD